MRDRVYIRVLNGQPAIFLGFPDADHVIVNFKGNTCCLTQAFWRSLRICR
jgi:hypothetical protein